MIACLCIAHALLFSAALLPAPCIDYWYSPRQAEKDQHRQIGKAQVDGRWIPYSGKVRIGRQLAAYTEWISSSSAAVQKPISSYRDYHFVGRVCKEGAR